MKKEDKSKLIEVFKGSQWEAELIKGLLNDNNIEAMIKDGLIANIVLPESVINFSVLVNEKDYDLATKIIRENEKS